MIFKCYHQEEFLGDFEIPFLGNHNVLNSISVIAVATELGLDYDTIQKGLSGFRGVGRRLENVGEENGIMVIDDYGHHPTEIKATLAALKKMDRKLVVVFQPHRYTRTELLYDEFGQCFSNADKLYITEIYPAGESPIEGVTSEIISKSVKKHEGREVHLIDKFEDIPALIADNTTAGDVVVTLGAGDIYKAGKLIIEELKNRG